MSMQIAPAKAWGKTARDGSGAWHSLVAHCIDVAAAGRAVMAVPNIRRALEHACGHHLSDIHLDRLAVLIGLHDLGKALAGFQGKIAPDRPPISNSHLPEILAVLWDSQDAREAIQVDMLGAWATDTDALLFASICHHGKPVEPQDIHRCRTEVSAQLERTAWGHEPVKTMREVMDALLDAYPQAQGAETPIDVTTSFEHLFAGIAQTSDWMGSKETRFFYTSGQDEGRARVAARIAQELLHDTAFSGWHRRAGDVLGSHTPRPMQALVEQVPTEQLAFIEAETKHRDWQRGPGVW